MREVGIQAFSEALARGAVVIDVREAFEYRAGHVPGAISTPLRHVLRRATELPTDQPVYVICATGNRSLTAADALARAGFEAWSVAGGTAAWRSTGRTVVRGRSAA